MHARAWSFLIMCAIASLLVLFTVTYCAAETRLQAPINCTSTGSNVCQCSGNGIALNISNYFNYPLNDIQDARTDNYTYYFSPCQPLEYFCTDLKTLICQSVDSVENDYYVPVARVMERNWTITSIDPLAFEIIFNHGDDYRQAKITFKYSDTDPSTIMMDQVGPIYNFQVTGNVVKRVDFTCNSTGVDVCQCSGKGIALNIHNYFNYPLQDIPDATTTKYTYDFSPCQGIPCGGVDGAFVCQKFNDGTGRHTVIAMAVERNWTISNTEPLTFVMIFNQGMSGRQAQITFQYNNSTPKMTMEGEDGTTYNFLVTGNVVKPLSSWDSAMGRVGGGKGGGGGGGRGGEGRGGEGTCTIWKGCTRDTPYLQQGAPPPPPPGELPYPPPAEARAHDHAPL